MTIDLNENEIRALSVLLFSANPCSGACAYSEMTKSKKDCDECKLQEAVYSIAVKIGYKEFE